MTELRPYLLFFSLLVINSCAMMGNNGQTGGLLHGHVSSEQITPVRVYIHQPGKMHWGLFGLTARVQNDGTFVVTDVPTGQYYLGGVSDGVTVYELSRLQGPMVEITPGDIGYLGSRRISGSAMILREGGTLEMTSQSRPDENELLRRLAERFENTEWQRPILRRLDHNLHSGQNGQSE